MSNDFGRRRSQRPVEPTLEAEAKRGGLALWLMIGAAFIAGGAVVSWLTSPKSSAPVVAQSASGQPTMVSLGAETVKAGGTGERIWPVVVPMTQCKARYPLDYDMRKVCESSQEEAKVSAETMRLDYDVQRLCADRYPEDWVMFVTCAKSQMDAKLPRAEKPDRPTMDIVKACNTEWPGKYSMQEHCIERHEKARIEAQGSWIDHDVAVECAGEWPTDWVMFVHCAKRELRAKGARG